MKERAAKWIGLALVLLVVGIAIAYRFFQRTQDPGEMVSGFVGGEKISFLENPEVVEILRRDYHMQLDIHKAGSLDMVRASHEGRSFLFPSSQTALEYYRAYVGSPRREKQIFNTPIVLYSHRPVAEALLKTGLLRQDGETYWMDMAALVTAMEEDKTWADLGLPQLYGQLQVDTTDPARSNSGNMFSGLVANLLNGGQVVQEKDVASVSPRLLRIFGKLGYMETSSSDLFTQFLRTGVGAKPLVAGYENQLLEFTRLQPERWAEVKDDIVILYPEPTVWSTHILISLDEQGDRLIEALSDERLLRIAWEQHGFRSGVYGSGGTETVQTVTGVADEITRIIPMPGQAAMEKIIEAFGKER
ncbi:MAG: hypothetical protein QM296_02295 [Bacillota bacterium]|nr:hypothetical protein [Bacillota bacterium]